MLDLDRHGLIAPTRPPARRLGPATVGDVLTNWAAAQPGAVALVGRSGRYTVEELDRAANRSANALAALGLRPGNRIAASLPNDCDIVIAFLGAMRLGAIWVGLNRPLAPPEKAFMLHDSGASLLLADPMVTEELEPLCDDLPELDRLITVDRSGGCEWTHRTASASDAPTDAEVGAFSPAAIAYTSGTTGFPKGAVHTHHNMLLPGAVSADRGLYPSGGTLGVALPLTILNLVILGPLVAYQNAMTLVAMDRIDAVGMAEWIGAEAITTFAAVPAMVHDLLTHPDVDRRLLDSLEGIGVGGADMPDAFRRMYRDRFGAPVGTGYGLTEAPTAVTVEDPTIEPIANTCGKALPQVDIVIVDDDDRPRPVGEAGEICVAPAKEGPYADLYRPMLGYWNRPEESAVALRNGLLHTGDIGLLDESGNLFIKDRRTDLIIRGGANVYPAEVERVLHESPAIVACAVVGTPDERLGQRVVGFVQLAPEANATTDELRTLCAEHLARYKVPDEMIFVDGFERTPMGKIRKTLLRESLLPPTT